MKAYGGSEYVYEWIGEAHASGAVLCVWGIGSGLVPIAVGSKHS